MSTQPSDEQPRATEPVQRDAPPRRDVPLNRLGRRREKIIAEIERNRLGGHTVPTWVLALVLLLIIAGFAAIVVLS